MAGRICHVVIRTRLHSSPIYDSVRFNAARRGGTEGTMYIRETARQRKEAAKARLRYIHVSTTEPHILAVTYDVGRNAAKRARAAQEWAR